LIPREKEANKNKPQDSTEIRPATKKLPKHNFRQGTTPKETVSTISL
jgi:hypothetical protein